MAPGASTNTIRRVPNVGPETISGPHCTSWPATSRVEVVGEQRDVQEAFVGESLDVVLVHGAREEGDVQWPERDVGAPSVPPLLGVGDVRAGAAVERHRAVEVRHFDREICNARDRHIHGSLRCAPRGGFAASGASLVRSIYGSLRCAPRGGFAASGASLVRTRGGSVRRAIQERSGTQLPWKPNGTRCGSEIDRDRLAGEVLRAAG